MLTRDILFEKLMPLKVMLTM